MGATTSMYAMRAKASGGFGGGGSPAYRLTSVRPSRCACHRPHCSCMPSPIAILPGPLTPDPPTRRPQEPSVHEVPLPSLVFEPLSDAQKEKIAIEGASAGGRDACQVASTSDEQVTVVAKLCRRSPPSADGETAETEEAAGAAPHDIGPLGPGSEFEVTIVKKASGSEGRHGIGIGVGPRGNLLHGSPWDRIWGYASSGNTWTRGSRTRSTTPFGAGDRVRVRIEGGKAAFFLNGKRVAGAELSGVSGDVWPVVVLPRRDDSVTIRLTRLSDRLIPLADHMWDPAKHAWARINPLHHLFLEAELRKTLPPPPKSDADVPEDLSDYLLEKHLWGPGLTPDAMDREVLKLASCMYSQLRLRADAESVIRVNAEARANKLLRLPKLVMQSARDAKGEVQLSVSDTAVWSATDAAVARSASGRVDHDGLLMWLATSGGVDEPQDPSDSGRIELSSRPSGMSRGDLKAAFNVFKKQTNATSGDSDEAYIQLHLQDVSLLPTVSRASTAGIWVAFFPKSASNNRADRPTRSAPASRTRPLGTCTTGSSRRPMMATAGPPCGGTATTRRCSPRTGRSRRGTSRRASPSLTSASR